VVAAILVARAQSFFTSPALLLSFSSPASGLGRGGRWGLWVRFRILLCVGACWVLHTILVFCSVCHFCRVYVSVCFHPSPPPCFGNLISRRRPFGLLREYVVKKVTSRPTAILPVCFLSILSIHSGIAVSRSVFPVGCAVVVFLIAFLILLAFLTILFLFLEI